MFAYRTHLNALQGNVRHPTHTPECPNMKVGALLPYTATLQQDVHATVRL
jgi:hypothetical protein